LRDPAGRVFDARASSASARGGGTAGSGPGDSGRPEPRYRAVRLRLRFAGRDAPVPRHGRGAPRLSVHGGSRQGSAGGGGLTFQSINPATGDALETFAETSPDALEGILERADRASRDWRRRPVAERAERLRAAARLLRERKGACARTVAREMGQALGAGAAAADAGAGACEHA